MFVSFAICEFVILRSGCAESNYRSQITSCTNSAMSIHPTAIVDPKSKSHDSCADWALLRDRGGGRTGRSAAICISHVAMDGPTTIGSDNKFFPFCSIGLAPQDISYKGEPTRLEIGDHNEIREFVTINRATAKGDGVTRVGSHNLIMAYTHIAHDCQRRQSHHYGECGHARRPCHRRRLGHSRRALPGASFRADWHPRLHWRRNDDHARCAAVFKNFGGARHACLWLECGWTRAAGIYERSDQEDSSRVPTAAGFEAEHIAGAGETEGRSGSRGRCGAADPVHRGVRARRDQVEAISGARQCFPLRVVEHRQTRQLGERARWDFSFPTWHTESETQLWQSRCRHRDER